ncbi:MAG TPA: VWA domain-containing protein [Pyrinomonadaceae bacterium]|nr:VWA domain-containing protein [Pyrinomonadaceae bacterium]
MGWLARRKANGNRAGFSCRKMMRFPQRSVVFAGLALALSISCLVIPETHSQSGRQKNVNAAASPTPASRPRQSTNSRPQSPPIISSSSKSSGTASDDVDVVKVSSHLVPVPTTVLDARGVAVTSLRLEDFELTVDGQTKPISDLIRSETPVRLAMLFDNSGSLDFARDFEKRAAVRFFGNVLRPVDQAAIYSVATTVVLSQPMTSNILRLQQTIDAFPKPEGATSLYDAIFEALTYLKPYGGRRVIVIVSDGRDTTSREDHDFEATLKRLSSDECQVYVVQTGVYDNANVRDLAAERRMQEFAAQTGGAAYIPRSVDELDTAFAQISADLAQQYILSYYPDVDKRDGKYHLINVRVKSQTNTRVRARKGFVVKTRES